MAASHWLQRRGIAVGTLAGCAADGGDDRRRRRSPSPGGTTATGDPLKGFWEDVAKEFEDEHPNVTVKITRLSRTKTCRRPDPERPALGRPARPLPAWGGGELADQVAAGQVQDITDDVADETRRASAADRRRLAVDGKTYGLPFSFGIEGFWYNKDLFAQAGITAPPTTLDELNDAVDKLKAAGIAPDRRRRQGQVARRALLVQLRPARVLPATSLQQAGIDLDFDDPCFVKAGEDLAGVHRRPSRSTRASSAPPPSRARPARPAWSPTARRPWSSWVTGTRASWAVSPRTRRGSATTSAGSPSRRSTGGEGDPTPRSAAATASPARARRRRSASSC